MIFTNFQDNHIKASGGISQAIECVRKYLADNNLKVPIEIECSSLDEIQQVMDLPGNPVNRIMLDNMTRFDKQGLRF